MLTVFKLLGALALLMFGMKAMSEALQKMAGPQLRHVLGAMTTNRFTGLLTGMFVTVAVQSSAATTVMTVSFVNAGLLSLAQAISVIMGANIGTTLSAWIMSAGFSFNMADFVWPAFFIGIILIYTKKRRYIGDFLFGVAFLFFALGTLNATGRELNLAENPAVVDFFASFNPKSYWTIFVFLIVGTLLTCLAQSSAAIMAITMVLCTTGVLNIYQGIALVMGENIGTTVTANVAAMSANTQARRAALAHLVFNVFGVLWVLVLFFPFVNLVCRIVGISDPLSTSLETARLSFALATFHTMFNVSNTLILIWFIPQIEKLVCKIIPVKAVDEDDVVRLKYIQSGIMKTPEISVLEAQKEIAHYVQRTQRMFAFVREMNGSLSDEDFQKHFERVAKYEDISDKMEAEIGKYLGEVSDAHLSDDTKAKIRSMFREINEIESVGDSCLSLSRALKRKRDSGAAFAEELTAKIDVVLAMLDNVLMETYDVVRGESRTMPDTRSVRHHCIDLSNENLTQLDHGAYSFTTGTVYNDIVTECGKFAGYVENVAEARLGVE